jgi:hypothetical protein
MRPLRRRSGNQHLHRTSQKYRHDVERKMNAYHVFMQAGVVSQGLLQYLAAVAPTQVWNSFGSRLRTIRPGVHHRSSSLPERYDTRCRIFS